MTVLPEFKLVAEPVSDDAKTMTFNPWSSGDVGTRHKLGGTPDFIQDDAWPICSSCGEKTVFYGQLDTYDDKDGLYNIADCGMIYVFFCFDCNGAVTLVQSA